MSKLLVKIEQNGLDIAPEFGKIIEWSGSCLWKVSFANENTVWIEIGNVTITLTKI